MNRFVVKNGSSVSISNLVRRGVLNGAITYIIEKKVEGSRLDMYANKHYGDPSLWWVIAAASGIGWWLQTPPGVLLYIPTDLNQIEDLKSRI